MTISGCGAHEPPRSDVVLSPTTRSGDASSADRTRIATMYEGYREEAFAGVDGIEVAEVTGLESRRPILLVDCREEFERDVSMIAGAVSQADFEADPETYRDRLIVPYCTIGYRSGVYTKSLLRRGYDAKNLVGGVLDWAHNDGAFVDAEGRPTRRVHVYGAEWDLLPETHESVYEGKSPP